MREIKTPKTLTTIKQKNLVRNKFGKTAMIKSYALNEPSGGMAVNSLIVLSRSYDKRIATFVTLLPTALR